MLGFQPIRDLTEGHLLALLAESDFSFSMRGWKGDAADFFAPTPEHEALLAERRACLDSSPARYCGALPESAPALEETAALAREWSGATISHGSQSPENLCRELALALEPDFIIAASDGKEPFRAIAGAVCFPSSWDFESTLGKSVHHIHAPVPGLNDALGERIEALLTRLPPGESWDRFNWGLSLSPDRNQHPSRKLPRLADATAPIDEAWLRVELQLLHKLPATRAVLFGIRLLSIPLSRLAANPRAAGALAHQLATMPPAMRDYKAIGQNAPLLDQWLSPSR